MNFATVDTLFTVYPSLMAVKRGVLNPMLFTYGNGKLPSLDASLKYVDRGCLLQSSVQSCMTDLEVDEDRCEPVVLRN